MRHRVLVPIAIAMVALGLLVPGFHHVRCVAVLESPGASTDGGCEETFPVAFAIAAAAVGVVGAALAIGLALSLAHREPRAAARLLLAIGALALLVPTVLPLAGWASTGFDLATPKLSPHGNMQCSGTAGRDPPFWLTTSTCITWIELVLVPLGAFSGALAAFAHPRRSRGLLHAALAVFGLATAVALLALLMGDARVAIVWIVPVAGACLLAASALLLRRPASHMPA